MHSVYNFKQWDIKHFWRLHYIKMQRLGETPVTYPRFWDRLERWWVLKDAIDTPSCKPPKVDTSKDLDELITMNRIQMPKPKPTLWRRIIKWFSRKREK